MPLNYQTVFRKLQGVCLVNSRELQKLQMRLEFFFIIRLVIEQQIYISSSEYRNYENSV